MKGRAKLERQKSICSSINTNCSRSNLMRSSRRCLLASPKNFQLSKILGCGIKFKKCVKIERENFTSPILLTFDNFELKMKMVSKFNRRASFLQKLMNVHHCWKLLTLHFDSNDLFLIVFKPSKNSSRVEKKSENGVW